MLNTDNNGCGKRLVWKFTNSSMFRLLESGFDDETSKWRVSFREKIARLSGGIKDKSIRDHRHLIPSEQRCDCLNRNKNICQILFLLIIKT